MRTIVSLGLNRALKWRPGQEPHDMREEFRTRVNEGREATPLIADEIRASTRLQER
jgi:hypothetical protein